jgi:hypothetical protein
MLLSICSLGLGCEACALVLFKHNAACSVVLAPYIFNLTGLKFKNWIRVQ